MRKDIPADIRLHADAQHVSPIVDDKQQQRAHQIREKRGDDEADKHAHHRVVLRHLRQKRAQDVLREHRVRDVDSGDQHRTG